VHADEPTYQKSDAGFFSSMFTYFKSKWKRLPVILFALITMVISSAIAQPAGPMVAGSYALTGSITWYDSGGAGGSGCSGSSASNYSNNANITETMTANAGQAIAVSWTSGTFGIASGDVLTVYDGPTTASPVLATYTTTTNPIPATIGATSANSITFHFTSNANSTCKGWEATITPYYYLQPGSFSFSCPGTYTFIDPQNAGSGGSGGDATCQVSGGNTKDYQDLVTMTETFSTSNGQCIQVDGSTPDNFGICSLDTLRVFDGPSTASPIANSGSAVYTNTFTSPAAFSTNGSCATFQFIANGNNHARGWQMSLSCVTCPAASINNDCANAIALIPGASCSYIASSVSAGNSSQGGVPACVGTANDDVWYRFIANNPSMQVTVAATDGTMDPVVQLLSGTCISFTSLYCQNATGVAGTETINAAGLTVGSAYYIRVYDFAVANANHTFNICVVGASPTDCLGAQQVCNTSMLTHSASGYPDYGTQEYNSSYWGCDVSGEIRSAWYDFQIGTSGKLGFTISALSGSPYMNCDFVLWGPFASVNCPMNTVPLRCSYAIGYSFNAYGLPPYSTGLEIGAGDFTEGTGGNGFVETVDAFAGQWYVLLVNIYGGPNSYNVTWMDNIPSSQQAVFSVCGGCTPPTISDAAVSADGSTNFCSGESVMLSVATAGLNYQWRNGVTSISGATNQSLSVTTSGSYICEVSNACGTATSNSTIVTVNNGPSAAQAAISAGGATTFCKGGSVVLTVDTGGLTYQWKKGNTIQSGVTQQSYTATKTGNYKCDVSNECGTTTSNTISVTINASPTSSISQAPCGSGAVLLTCTYTPTSGVTFKWKKDGTIVSGATNSTYSATQNATYKCIVTITATGCTKASAGSNVTITCKSGDVLEDNKVIVYPNPTADYFNISTAKLDLQSVIYIYDLTGRLVETHEVNGNEMKVGETLSNGVYFLKIAADSEVWKVIKLVKNF